MFTEKQIEKQMKANHCTRDEAIEILQWDYDIDHGDKEKGALTAEQKKLVRSVTKADKDPAKKRTVTKERKVDADKKTVFDWLRILFEGHALNGLIKNLTCKNEGKISFDYNGNAYTVTITKHRAQKG